MCVLGHSESHRVGSSLRWEGASVRRCLWTLMQGQVKPFLILNLEHRFSFGRVGRSENCGLSSEKRHIHTAHCIQSHSYSDCVTDQPVCSVLNPRTVLPQAGVGDQSSVLKKFPCSSWIPDLRSLRTGPLGAGSSKRQWHAHQFTLIELPPEPRWRVSGRQGYLAP